MTASIASSAAAKTRRSLNSTAPSAFTRWPSKHRSIAVRRRIIFSSSRAKVAALPRSSAMRRRPRRQSRSCSPERRRNLFFTSHLRSCSSTRVKRSATSRSRLRFRRVRPSRTIRTLTMFGSTPIRPPPSGRSSLRCAFARLRTNITTCASQFRFRFLGPAGRRASRSTSPRIWSTESRATPSIRCSAQKCGEPRPGNAGARKLTGGRKLK